LRVVPSTAVAPSFLENLRRWLDFPIASCVYWNAEREERVTMSQNEPRSRPPLYSQIDVAQATYGPAPGPVRPEAAQTHLLQQLLAGQDRQNELLEELVNLLGAAQKQRASELGQWKQANPHLARSCRMAAESLGRIQTEFLDGLTQEIHENAETLMDGEFMLNEFVDRFGPRMAHLNGLLQVLSQLSATADPANTPNSP
jgi:hypothetical protein